MIFKDLPPCHFGTLQYSMDFENTANMFNQLVASYKTYKHVMTYNVTLIDKLPKTENI